MPSSVLRTRVQVLKMSAWIGPADEVLQIEYDNKSSGGKGKR